ncbi:MAG TPA: TonB family protein [Terriglobales bacterium]|nr:TonB family protein [Terriglobales bacterium]
MAANSKIEHGVVELRTDVGRLYVSPSFWQGLYLRWTFRNFHNLPQQVLNHRQQRLIDNLWRNAIVTTTEPIGFEAVIGVVENMRVLTLPANAETVEVKRIVEPALAEKKVAILHGSAAVAEPFDAAATVQTPAASIAVPASAQDSVLSADKLNQETPAADAVVVSAERNLQLRAPLVALMSAAALVLLVFELAPAWRLLNENPAAPKVASQAAVPVEAPTPVAIFELKPTPPVKSAPPATVVSKPLPTVESLLAPKLHAAGTGQPGHVDRQAATTAPEATASLPQIAEAPQAGFIYPVAPKPNLVGKVVLKAIVGSDGAVKQVEVLSGNRALAAAAARAVRHWRYAPAEVQGQAVEAETDVTVSFLGDDAVSIILPQHR